MDAPTRGVFNMGRPAVTCLFVGTYLTVVTFVALIFEHPNPQDLFLTVLAFFPLGLAPLFVRSVGQSPTVALILGYIFYLMLTLIGVITRKKLVYLFFALVLLANIGGCIMGFRGN